MRARVLEAYPHGPDAVVELVVTLLSAVAGRLETRKVLDRAKGILQRDMGISEDQAYRTMQRESRQRRRSMREIADAILLGDDLKKIQADGDQKASP